MPRSSTSVGNGIALVSCCCWLLLLVAWPPAAAQGGGDSSREWDLCCTTGDYLDGQPLCDRALSGKFWGTRGDPGPSDLQHAVEQCESKTFPSGFTGYGVIDMRCRPVGSIAGDPHVTGFDGSEYLLWGKPNATYNLISERTHHINVRLYQPPSLPAGHALFIEAVGIMINAARITVHLEQPAAGTTVPAPMVLVVHNSAGSGQESVVTWTGHSVKGGTADASTFYSFKTQTQILVTSRDAAISILHRGDHLDVNVVKVAPDWADVHGIMGQTHSAAFSQSAKRSIIASEGTAVGEGPPGTQNSTVGDAAAPSSKQLALQGKEEDYITSGLLQADDKFSRFVGTPAALPLVVTRRKMLAVNDGVSERQQLQNSIAGVSGGAAGAPSLPAGPRRSLLESVLWGCQ